MDIARAVADGVGTCTAESLLQVRYLQDVARKSPPAARGVAAERGQSVWHVKASEDLYRIGASQETPIWSLSASLLCGIPPKSRSISKKELAMLRELYAEIEGYLRPASAGTGIRPELAVPYFAGDDFATLSPAKGLAQALHEVSSWVHLDR